MSPLEYAALTGQHDQVTQQARMFIVTPPQPTRVEAFYGCKHAPSEDWLRDAIEAWFRYPERIDIEQWTFPAEEAAPVYDAEYYREMAGDTASDEDRT